MAGGVGHSLPSDQNRSGRSLGAEELEYLREVINSGTLFAPKGSFVSRFETAFASWLRVDEAVACSSGTAAIHSALAAIDPEPGDEVITTPITDMGALTPILYQGAVPVFSDVDPATGNITAASVAERIGPRTRAIIATHLFGNPCEIDPILDIASNHDIPVIEDCAQAYGATHRSRMVGTFGDLACFSLQQGKHITTGEGGAVAGSAALLHRIRLFVNKAWDYDQPSDHEFLALNYRMSELQGAVALAQIDKLDEGIAIRRDRAQQMDLALAEVEGVTPLAVDSDDHPSYWRYCLLVDTDVIPGGPTALGEELRSLGFASAPRYVQKPAFRCGVFANQRTFGQSRWPFTLASPQAVDYSPERFLGTFSFLDRVLVLPWNERYSSSDVDRLADAVTHAVEARAGVPA